MSIDRWINKEAVVHITVKCYSVIKRNTFESVLMRWMNLEPIIQSEISQKDRDKYHILVQWHPTPVLLPGKSHGWRSLVGYSPWSRWVRHDWVTSLSHSCIGEGNGNPLQCSCLENPRDGGAGGLPSMGSHRVGHDWSELAVAAASSWNYSGCLYLGKLLA